MKHFQINGNYQMKTLFSETSHAETALPAADAAVSVPT